MPATAEEPSPAGTLNGQDPGRDSAERAPVSRGSSWDRKTLFWILAALLVAVPSVVLPAQGLWLSARTFALEAAGIVLAVLVFSRGEWTRVRVKAALLSPVNLAILGFIIWVAASVPRSGLPVFSRYEAMRHLGGVLIFFAVAYGISVRRHLGHMMAVLLAAAALASLLAFLNAGETNSLRVAGAFRNEQLLAGFLCLLLPLVLMVSLADEESWRRMAGQVVLVIVVAALLLSRNRSAWAGSAVGLLVAAGLYLRYVRGSLGFQKHQIVIPVLMVLLSFGLFLAMSRTGGMLSERLGTLSVLERDSSFRWRRAMWDKAARMIRDRPVLGWGVGAFPLQQALYYHPDAPGRSQLEIYYLRGPTLKENAHNTFLQLGAELGIPGLALFLGIYAAFFATAWRALRHMRAGFRQAVLIGAIAGIAGQFVSGVGSPAWEFAECSLFFWVILGLGMAVAGLASRGVETSGQKGASYEGVRTAAAVS